MLSLNSIILPFIYFSIFSSLFPLFKIPKIGGNKIIKKIMATNLFKGTVMKENDSENDSNIYSENYAFLFGLIMIGS